jgi:hypothetical protein
VVEKRKTYQRLETRLRLESLSLLLRAMPVVVVVTVGSLLLSEVTWLLFGGHWSSSSSSSGVVFGVVKSAKENHQPRSSMATRPTSALKPPGTHASSNGVKEAETAALLVTLRGSKLFKFN